MDKEKIIENLIHAEKNKIQINFFKENEKLAKSESYQLQKNLVDEKKRIFNSDLAGYKISMTSSDTQAIANTHEPAYGRILRSEERRVGKECREGGTDGHEKED